MWILRSSPLTSCRPCWPFATTPSKQAANVGDLVLPSHYRVEPSLQDLGSIRARQALRHLQSLAPPTMYGHLAGRTAGQFWFALQLRIEASRYEGCPVTGVTEAIADLEKAFNLIPRVPVLAAARVLGLVAKGLARRSPLHQAEIQDTRKFWAGDPLQHRIPGEMCTVMRQHGHCGYRDALPASA